MTPEELEAYERIAKVLYDQIRDVIESDLSDNQKRMMKLELDNSEIIFKLGFFMGKGFRLDESDIEMCKKIIKGLS